MIDKKTLLTSWLRSKSFHTRDIAVALHWYDKQCEIGVVPDDKLVYGVAKRSHEKAIANSRDQIPDLELNVIYKLQAKIVSISLIGGICGALILYLIIHNREIYQWLLAQMQ